MFVNLAGTVIAECAFERTDQCTMFIGWQVPVACFARWVHLKHDENLLPIHQKKRAPKGALPVIWSRCINQPAFEAW